MAETAAPHAPLPVPLPNAVAAMAPQLTAWRRAFHAAPELSGEEHRTAERVAEILRAVGCDTVETGIGGVGVVATIRGERPEAGAIMLRADMDALPILEATGAPHTSATPGVMHACGHDGHMTMLLGAAEHLAATRGFAGSVHLVFQPAEETGRGAAAMIADGLFERFPTRAIYGLHNWPGLALGEMAVSEGAVFARGDEITITVSGRGGHAAEPHLARDPLVVAARLVLALQSVVSREIDPRAPAVVSITGFEAGTAHNIIPDRAVLKGTTRCFSEAVAGEIHAAIERICAGTAAAHGVAVDIARGEAVDPPVVNDAAEARRAHGAMSALLGPSRAHFGHPPSMAAEDFGHFARIVPAAFAIIGMGEGPALHHPAYDFNDAALPLGVAYWLRLVEAALPRG